MGSTPPALLYNDAWLNGSYDYLGCAPGTGSISENPLFVAPDTDGNPYNDDWRLQPLSPCIDAGDPDPAFNDPDGTRNDMGIYGGPHAAP